MNSEQTRLALCIIIPALMVLIFIIWQFYCDEKNRRKFYENKYYQEPRVHHYNKKKWFTRLFAMLIIFSLFSCEKEVPKKKLCMKCSFSFADKSFSVPDLDTCYYNTDPIPDTKFYDDKGNQASVNCTYY